MLIFFSGYLLDCDIKNVQYKMVSIINNNTKCELKKLVLSLGGHFHLVCQSMENLIIGNVVKNNV